MLKWCTCFIIIFLVNIKLEAIEVYIADLNSAKIDELTIANYSEDIIAIIKKPSTYILEYLQKKNTHDSLKFYSIDNSPIRTDAEAVYASQVNHVNYLLYGEVLLYSDIIEIQIRILMNEGNLPENKIYKKLFYKAEIQDVEKTIPNYIDNILNTLYSYFQISDINLDGGKLRQKSLLQLSYGVGPIFLLDQWSQVFSGIFSTQLRLILAPRKLVVSINPISYYQISFDFQFSYQLNQSLNGYSDMLFHGIDVSLFIQNYFWFSTQWGVSLSLGAGALWAITDIDSVYLAQPEIRYANSPSFTSELRLFFSPSKSLLSFGVLMNLYIVPFTNSPYVSTSPGIFIQFVTRKKR